MSNDFVKIADESNFDQLLMGKDLTIVDFWAEWCGPCKMLIPIIDKIAELYDGKATVAKLNVDMNSKIAEKFSIRTIPTILIFRKGELIDTLVGFKPKAVLAKILDTYLELSCCCEINT